MKNMEHWFLAGMLLCVLVIDSSADSTVTFTEHILDTAAYGANSIYACDVDGDGDTDILSASIDDDKIKWYRNDGNKNFTSYVISANADGAYSVYACDVDDDGDMDVLSASYTDNKIAWYENNGSQFFTEHVISTAANGAYSVHAFDIDGDGDMDVISGGYDGNKVAWYENNGAEVFTTHVMSTFNSGRSVYACDIDGDGDGDILAASHWNDETILYKNNGGKTFSMLDIDKNFDNPSSLYAIDIDGDEDMDILSTSSSAKKIICYVNDGSANFTIDTIAEDLSSPRSVYACDINLDGDMDVLSVGGSYSSVGLTWYENDGNENFTSNVIANNTYYGSFYAVFAADIDGDGDMDVLRADKGDNNIKWYENMLPALITYQDRDSVKSDTTEHTFVMDNDPVGTMDTIITTTKVDTITDITFHLRDTYNHGKFMESVTCSVSIDKRGEVRSQNEVTKPYQLPYDLVSHDVVTSDTIELTFITDNDPTGTMDTIVTTTVVDSITDSIWIITDTLLNSDTIGTSDPVFKSVLIWFDTLSVSDEVKSYQNDSATAIEQFETVQGSESIIFVPNPVSLEDEEISFVVPKTLRGRLTVAILDNLGNVIDFREFNSASGNGYRWDLRNESGVPVSPGMYLAVIKVEQNDGSKKTFTRSVGVRK